MPQPQYESNTHETAPPAPKRSGRFELLRHAVRLAACVALVTGQANAAAARDFLWKVSGTTGSIYLVGSVHLLTKDFYPLSPALESAFKESDLLVEEADLAEMLSPAAQMQMLARGMLPANTTLDAVVSPATFDLVVTRAKEMGLPVEPLKRFKPWSLALMLSSLQWQKAGFDGELGLDRHFYDQARADGRQDPHEQLLDHRFGGRPGGRSGGDLHVGFVQQRHRHRPGPLRVARDLS